MSRGRGERTVVYAWERRSPSIDWFSRKHLRGAVAAAGVLAGLGLLGSAQDYRRRAHVTRAAISSVMIATETFRAEHGRCPADIHELAHPPATPTTAASYLREARVDGWGRPFRMTCPGRKHPWSADVVSGGPSGTFQDLDQIE